MEIIYAEQQVPYEGTVVALGNFDGLHVAHMMIIRRCITTAQDRGLKSGVMLFRENTKNRKLITPNDEKLSILRRENPDFVYIRSFTKEFMHKSAREFVELMIKNLHIRAVCVGYDYRFGHKAEGNVEMLKAFGREYGFSVLVTPKVSMGNHVIHSTYIRKLIETGEIRTANRLLGRRFYIKGKVIHGKGNGHKIGFPTANVEYDNKMAMPKEGVYAGITYVDGKRCKCVINVGKNPTFDAKEVTVESYILDFDEDIYDKEIKVSFVRRLRDDVKFNSAAELADQIKKDAEAVEGLEM